jgi:hypothetical protein
MDYQADRVLSSYFADNISRIQKWFNIINPKRGTMSLLKSEISELRNKNWKAIHST